MYLFYVFLTFYVFFSLLTVARQWQSSLVRRMWFQHEQEKRFWQNFKTYFLGEEYELVQSQTDRLLEKKSRRRKIFLVYKRIDGGQLCEWRGKIFQRNRVCLIFESEMYRFEIKGSIHFHFSFVKFSKLFSSSCLGVFLRIFQRVQIYPTCVCVCV